MQIYSSLKPPSVGKNKSRTVEQAVSGAAADKWRGGEGS